MASLPTFHPRFFVLQTEPQARRLKAILDAAWESYAAAGRPLEVVVSEWKIRRNAAQNRYYWRMLNKAADQVVLDGRRFSSDAWHEEAKGRFLGYEDLPSGQKRALSSRDLPMGEFAQYVTQVEAWLVGTHGVVLDDYGHG